MPCDIIFHTFCLKAQENFKLAKWYFTEISNKSWYRIVNLIAGRPPFLAVWENQKRKKFVKRKVNQIVSVKGAVKEVRERKYCVDLTWSEEKMMDKIYHPVKYKNLFLQKSCLRWSFLSASLYVWLYSSGILLCGLPKISFIVKYIS